jgi:hypothetical protein
LATVGKITLNPLTKYSYYISEYATLLGCVQIRTVKTCDMTMEKQNPTSSHKDLNLSGRSRPSRSIRAEADSPSSVSHLSRRMSSTSPRFCEG